MAKRSNDQHTSVNWAAFSKRINIIGAISSFYSSIRRTIDWSDLDNWPRYFCVYELLQHHLPDVLQYADGTEKDECSNGWTNQHQKFQDRETTSFKNESIWFFEFVDVNDISEKEGKDRQWDNQWFHRWRHWGKISFLLFCPHVSLKLEMTRACEAVSWNDSLTWQTQTHNYLHYNQFEELISIYFENLIAMLDNFCGRVLVWTTEPLTLTKVMTGNFQQFEQNYDN